MSYGEELWEEQMIDAFIMRELGYQNAWRNFKNNIWTMGNGKEINIEDMETSHIKNCINMLKRNEHIVDLDDLWIEKFETELDIRNVIGG